MLRPISLLHQVGLTLPAPMPPRRLPCAATERRAESREPSSKVDSNRAPGNPDACAVRVDLGKHPVSDGSPTLSGIGVLSRFRSAPRGGTEFSEQYRTCVPRHGILADPGRRYSQSEEM